MLKFHPVHFLVLLIPSNFRCPIWLPELEEQQGLFGQWSWKQSIWPTWGACSTMARTHSTAQLDGCSPPGFSLMGLFWSERLNWPLLPCTPAGGQRDGIGRRDTAVPSPTPHCWGSCSTAQGELWAAAWQCPWPWRWKPHLWLLEGDETLQTLAVAVEGSSEPSSCL